MIKMRHLVTASDLARIYETETKRINESVKRNIERFPERFCFRITEEEYNFLKPQFATSKGGSRKGHTVFREQGVAMLATVLKTKIAIEVSIKIMDAFVTMRKYMSSNLLEQNYINNMLLEHEYKIKLLQDSFQKIEEKKKVNEIYFNGQIYDAYSKIQEIFKSANKRLVIIDAYLDNAILDIVKRLKVEVTIITKSNNLLTSQDIEKYNKQYNNLTVIFNNTFHDRYFILDKKIVYHCGSSINRIGYKTFSITLIDDKDIKNTLLDKIKEIGKEN